MEEEMKFIDYIEPPLQNGKYRVMAAQSVTAPDKQEFSKDAEFHVAGYAFTLEKEHVFSMYPAENESGEFGDLLPFIVMDVRTFPWENHIGTDSAGTPLPWVALLTISEREAVSEKDMPIEDLLDKKEEGVFYPDKSKLPSVFAEKKTDSCHVLDLPRQLYDEIMPAKADLPFLCHAKYVNLKRTEDEVCAKDGYFSVICGNRFIPSGEESLIKSTIHLVSLLGMEDLSVPPDCRTVRLVSLHHWDVFSKKNPEESFDKVIDQLKSNCGVIGYSGTDLEKLGYCIKKHLTRTGEYTYSQYRSPLIPFSNTEQLGLENKHTADGYLIYDKDTGIFDVTYASAWQLGRMLALEHPTDAEKIVRFRKQQKLKTHRNCVRANVDFQKLDIEYLLTHLTEQNAKKGGSDEENTDDTTVDCGGQSVFRGYH